MRLWEVRFQVMKAVPFMPEPDEIALEYQDSPVYHIEGRGRDPLATQIVTTISGEGVFRFGSELHRMTPGKTFCAAHNNPDTAYYYPGSGVNPWIFLWISFYGNQAIRLTDYINQKHGYVFELPLDRGFIPHLEAYKTLSGTYQVVTPTAGAKIVHDALAALTETIEKERILPKKAILARNAQAMIAANLDRELDIRAIAEKLQVSREHLSRIFHEETGLTPAHFAASERLRTARRLLRDNTLTCKEIAERLGYVSSASFARAFKNLQGISPKEYKQQNLFGADS